MGINLTPGMVGVRWLDRETMKTVQFYPEKPLEWFFEEKVGGENFYRVKRYFF